MAPLPMGIDVGISNLLACDGIGILSGAQCGGVVDAVIMLRMMFMGTVGYHDRLRDPSNQPADECHETKSTATTNHCQHSALPMDCASINYFRLFVHDHMKLGLARTAALFGNRVRAYHSTIISTSAHRGHYHLQ